MYAGCVSGAIQMEAYLGIIDNLGFRQVTVHKQKSINIPDEIQSNYLTETQLEKFRNGGTGIFSITVSGKK